MSRLKAELQFLRKKGALKSRNQSETSVGRESSPEKEAPATKSEGRCCARCRTGLGRIINRGALCKSCRQRVCKACREYNVPRHATSAGTDWVCTVCFKTATVEAATGEWMNSFIRRPSRQRLNKEATDGGEIVARGIRRSWTISNPSSTKEETSTLSAELVQVYHQPARKQPDDADHQAKPVVWEPRDPPLQYCVIPDEASPARATRSRLEPRRSASLSQADLVSGKMFTHHHHEQQHHQIPSPARPPPPREEAASRYHDYYENKYEKPVRRQDVPRSRTGVDIDTVLKSRWRSTSPPPAPVDDWLPIKPPQLAWAKPVVPVVELPGKGRKPTRIPLPVNSMARSVSSDMDHMIYLERDLPDVMLRERTRSIDRLAASGNRIAYKTYEEELADYHGRTGSVDRLAVTRRPRTTIRMGTQSTAGRSVPVSLERRHSEISVGRRRESGDSSGNSSSSRHHSSISRRGSITDVSDGPAVAAAAPASALKPAARSANNVNRVYIDGSGPEEGAVAPRIAQPAIRVTMTDTRSLKRPTQKIQGQSYTVESSTMPRMSKRQGVARQAPANKPPPGAIQQHPGATTVYLAHDQPETSPTPTSRTQQRVDAETAYRKTTPKRIKTDADGMPGHAIKRAIVSPVKRTTTRTVEERVTLVKEVRELVKSAPTTNQAAPIPPAPDPSYESSGKEEDSDCSILMQDASVQTSELGQDYEHSREEADVGTGGSESDATNEEIARCTSLKFERESSQVNSSDTASELGAILLDKMQPEGDDYKLVFISSDSSKSGSSLDGSFDHNGSEVLRQTSSSLRDSESAAGFIDESDWDFFASRGQLQQQQHSVTKAALVTVLTESRVDESFDMESPRLADDLSNYGWDETSQVFEDGLPWTGMVTYSTRQVQTDFDGASSVDFEAEPVNAEYESISHIIRRVSENFVPIWQVPASTRASNHSLHSLISDTASNQNGNPGGGGGGGGGSGGWPGTLRGFFNRSDSKRSSGERSMEEFHYRDHILSLEPTSSSFISSLYSPDGLALPGFQEYRDQIFTEIQAYTAKGDWNLSGTSSPVPSTGVSTPNSDRSVPFRTRNAAWIAGPLLGKVNNTYRIRPTGSRVPAKRWRSSGDSISGDSPPPAASHSRSEQQQTSHATCERQESSSNGSGHFHSARQLGNNQNSHATGEDSATRFPSTPEESRASNSDQQSISSSASSSVESHRSTVVAVNVNSSRFSRGSSPTFSSSSAETVSGLLLQTCEPTQQEQQQVKPGEGDPLCESGPLRQLEQLTEGTVAQVTKTSDASGTGGSPPPVEKHDDQDGDITSHCCAASCPHMNSPEAPPPLPPPPPPPSSPPPPSPPPESAGLDSPLALESHSHAGQEVDGDTAAGVAVGGVAEGQPRFQVTPAPVQLGDSTDTANDTSGDDGFDTDTQQDTVVGNHPAYHDLRQFALRQAQQQQQTATSNDASDSESSSSKNLTASPVPSDGRLTPRKHTSYVLITQENKNKDVISESGVTVTLPSTVVEVPDSWTEATEASDSETNEESSSCVTISGNALTDEIATSDDDLTITERGGDSKLAKYFTFELESGSNYRDSRKQPVVYKNQPERASSPDPYNQESEEEEEEEASFASSIDEPSNDQDTLQYESEESRMDSINEGDGESLYSESSGDEVYMDQEEELRGYNRAIDFTLHTILEESCEESDGERRSRNEKRSKETSELEKYFTHGLGSGEEPKRRTSFANEESEYSDTFSETSSSIYSEGRSGGEEEEDVDPVELASSRLEKYFRTNFLGLENAPRGGATDEDSSESVGSDSEGHASPEQQRRKKVMKTRGLRQQARSDVDDAAADATAEPDARDSSAEDDDGEDEEEEIVMEKDGQFDTIKRKKKKRSGNDASNQQAVEKQMAAVEELNAQQTETVEKADEEKKDTPPAVAEEPAPTPAAGLDPNCPKKYQYQSRDSGFVGSCDDLLNDSQKEMRQRLSSESGSSDGADNQEKRSHSSSPDAVVTKSEKPDEGDTKSGKSIGSSGSSGDHAGSLTSTSMSSKSGKLSRKDSFNNWSSDEETNLMMNKMRAFFRNMVSGGASGSDEKVKPPQLVVFETELTRLMKSVPGINDQQVKEIVEYLSSEDTWSDSYDSSDYTSSDLEAAGVVLDQSALLPEFLSTGNDLQQQISASCQEIIEKFDLDRSPDVSHDTSGPWYPTGDDNSLTKETAFVYQRLVNSLLRLNNGPKPPVASAPSTEETPAPHQNSPPMIAKVLHHIGNRLVALMHEVSASSPDTTSHSGSIDEDAQSANRLKEMRLAAHFEPVTSSPRLPKIGRLYVSNKDVADDKRSLSTSVDSEDTPTDTEQSPDSDDSRKRTKKKADSSGSSLKYNYEGYSYEKRTSSLPPQLGAGGSDQGGRSGYNSLPDENSRSGFIGGSRSLKARLAERARTLEAERRRLADEQQQQQQAAESAADEDPADEDRFYKKARKLPRFNLFGRMNRDSRENALQSSSSGVSDIAEEKEDEFSGWRSSFESAIAADSRTKLSLEAKRRSAGSASSSELFASTGELLDRDSSRGLRVRGASAGHSSKFSLPNLLERDAVRMARERDRERSASSDVLLSTSPVASSVMLTSVADAQSGEDDDPAWDRLAITRMSSKRRSSVPDTREERSADATEPRSTTLPRSATALSAVDNEMDSSPSISASTAGVKKSLSLLLSHSGMTNSASESSLNTSIDATPVRSARYRPPGFRGQTPQETPRIEPRGTPTRAPSAPRLEAVTPRSTGSASSISARRNVRSMLADERREPYASSPSFVREGLRTSMASSVASGESFSSVSASDTMDDGDMTAPSNATKTRSSSLSALGNRSDSMASVYSAAGENRYGTVAVRGEIQFGLHYNYRQTALEVFVKQCRDLAPVDTKRNRSDPYAKVYLLPDRSKSGKRKTKVKKHTLSPLFEENLKFTASLSDLENRTLWLTVWHSDMFGRNDFLGEVLLPLAGRIFDDPTPHWYPLQERSEIIEDPVPMYRGDIIVALKYVTGDNSPSKRTKKSKGALHVMVKEAKGLIAIRPNGNIDALCKATLMPEKGKTTKHKTNICRRTSNPVWNCTFIFDDVSHQELKERALELAIWNHDRLATKEFLGGIRLSLGTGALQGKAVEWMDAVGKEVTLWQSVVERAGLWVEGSVPLRVSLERAATD